MKRARTLSDMYSFPGFQAAAMLQGVFGDPHRRIVTLGRKKRPASVRCVTGSAARCTTGVWRVPGIGGRPGFVSNLSLNAFG